MTQGHLESLSRNIFENELIIRKVSSFLDNETLSNFRLLSKMMFQSTLKQFRSNKWYNIQTFGSVKNLEIQPVDYGTMQALWSNDFLNFKKFPIEQFKLQWGIQSESLRLGDMDERFYKPVKWMFENIGPYLKRLHVETNVKKLEHFQRNCEFPICERVQHVQLTLYNPREFHTAAVPLFLIKFDIMKSFILRVPEVENFNNSIDTKDVYECIRYNMEDWFYLEELGIEGNVPTKMFFEKMDFAPFTPIIKFRISPTNGYVDLISFQEFLKSHASKIETLLLKIDTDTFHKIEWPAMKALKHLAVTEIGDASECNPNATPFELGVMETFPKLSTLILSVKVATGTGEQNVNYLRRSLSKFLPDHCNYKMENLKVFHFSDEFGEINKSLDVYKYFAKKAAVSYPSVKNWFFNEVRQARASDEDYYNYCKPDRYFI